MGRLTHRDIETILRLSLEIYGHQDLETFPSVILSTLQGLIRADSSSFNAIDFRTGSVTPTVLPHEDPPLETLKTFMHYISKGEHPVINSHLDTRDGRARKTSDFYTQTEFHSLGIYNDFYRYRKVEYQLIIELFHRFSPVSLAGIAFNRQKNDFTDEDRDLLNAIYPHIYST